MQRLAAPPGGAGRRVFDVLDDNLLGNARIKALGVLVHLGVRQGQQEAAVVGNGPLWKDGGHGQLGQIADLTNLHVT